MTGDAKYLDVLPGPPLGVGVAGYSQVTVALPEASTVVLFTDELLKRRDESLIVGRERLRRAVSHRSLPPETTADHILRTTGMGAGVDNDVPLLLLCH